jgi:hypothetical protein
MGQNAKEKKNTIIIHSVIENAKPYSFILNTLTL